MLIDTHTHIKPYSFDGQQSLDSLLQSVHSPGLDGVCLTDHYEKDVSYVDGLEAVFDLDDYFARLSPFRQTNPGSKPLFLIGIELGYLPHLDDYYTALVPEYPFDEVILSLHILDNEDPYVDLALFERDKQAVYGRYLEQMRDMTRSCPDFDILGHFDYISRYATYPERKLFYRDQADRFDDLFQTLISAGKILEINTGSVRHFAALGFQGTDAWPDPQIIQRYLELGGELISLGSDAHQFGGAGLQFPETIAWLQSLGCRYLAHLINRQIIMTSIDDPAEQSRRQP